MPPPKVEGSAIPRKRLAVESVTGDQQLENRQGSWPASSFPDEDSQNRFRISKLGETTSENLKLGMFPKTRNELQLLNAMAAARFLQSIEGDDTIDSKDIGIDNVGHLYRKSVARKDGRDIDYRAEYLSAVRVHDKVFSAANQLQVSALRLYHCLLGLECDGGSRLLIFEPTLRLVSQFGTDGQAGKVTASELQEISTACSSNLRASGSIGKNVLMLKGILEAVVLGKKIGAEDWAVLRRTHQNIRGSGKYWRRRWDELEQLLLCGDRNELHDQLTIDLCFYSQGNVVGAMGSYIDAVAEYLAARGY